MEEAVSVEAARATPLSVSVYVDETAPGDVAAHVRQAFASASDTARVSLIYLNGREFAPSSGDDMACIVAGLDENVGAYARACRKAGVPAMVVTTLPQLVGAIAKAAGCAIPEADIVAPKLTAKGYEHVSTAAGQGPAITAKLPPRTASSNPPICQRIAIASAVFKRMKCSMRYTLFSPWPSGSWSATW